MTIFYNCTGTRRKELVTAISEITGAKAEYQFMPTQAYQIDYFTVDKDGNLCPSDNRLVSFSVKGAGRYRAAANGDATSLDLFHLPKMPAFSGQLTAIVQSTEQSGEIVFEAKAKGLQTGTILLSADR